MSTKLTTSKNMSETTSKYMSETTSKYMSEATSKYMSEARRSITRLDCREQKNSKVKGCAEVYF